MNSASRSFFNFNAYKNALTSNDVRKCLDFFADDAEWIEYKRPHPPKEILMLRGKQEIAKHLTAIKESGVTLSIEDEVVTPNRAAFCILCTRSDGKRLIENALIHFKEGRIIQQIDVETSDNSIG